MKNDKQLSHLDNTDSIYLSDNDMASEYYDRNQNFNDLQLQISNVQFLENTSSRDLKQSHVGYYLIDKGIEILEKKLDCIPTLKGKIFKLLKNNISQIYIFSFFIINTIACIIIEYFALKRYNNIFLACLVGILSFIPLSEIYTQAIQYILSKIVKSFHMPKMDYLNGIPQKDATFVVVPTILTNKEKVLEQIKNLEVYYLANKSENMYFALLGDCSEEKEQVKDFDKDIIEEGIKQTKILNDKYKSNNFPLFHFLYRQRLYNEKQGSYLGWERKRGIINEFNKYLLHGEKGTFICNTIEEWLNVNNINGLGLPHIQYIITLDADTNLVLNSGLEMIGAMSHILNKPEMSHNRDCVVRGYALMQPRVGLDISSSLKSIFTRIFGGYAGTDVYTNAASEFYQDIFNEGIFTGKGIYDLYTFNTVLENKIKENTVLSHDLLEGSYLRCGLLTDVVLLDGYPSKYSSYIKRLHRWIRGDWQIIGWLREKFYNNEKENKQGAILQNSEIKNIDNDEKKKNELHNSLNLLSKFKIFDNLRRSLLQICLILLILINKNYVLTIIICFMPAILTIINAILFKKQSVKKQKLFSPIIDGIKGEIYRCTLSLAFLPHMAYISLHAIITTIYRITISHKNLLDWITADQRRKKSK